MGHSVMLADNPANIQHAEPLAGDSDLYDPAGWRLINLMGRDN